jgi:tetratricopeptide (TPR) repeat protein
MAVDLGLTSALTGWLVSLVGDAGIRLIRQSPDERALRAALGLAIDRVVEQVDASSQQMLRAGLQQCFSDAPRMGFDASGSVSEGLRAAIAAQVAQLDQMVHNDTGQSFYQTAAVDRDWLVKQLTEAILAVLPQIAAAHSVPELVHALYAEGLATRLDELSSQISALRDAAPAAAIQTLPRDISSFTGRHGLLRQLVQAVTNRVTMGQPVGIYAIDGMAGVGKTAFAVHAAHLLAPLFPDGQIFVRFHAHTPGRQPVNPAEALSTVLLAIGIAPQRIPAGLPARELLWRDHLSGKKVLLVLDDVTGPQQVDPLLPGTAQSLVLLTSRRRLATLDDAMPISLDPLALDEAAALFVRVAGRPDLQPTDAAVADVIRLCRYLPLALRLVAGRLRRHSTWTLSDVGAELAGAESRLTAIDAGERSIAAAFDLSYRDLTDDQQRLFRRLGLHPGPDIDAYAAAALHDTTLTGARRDIENLYDLHLLDEPVRGRYRLHDLIRDYARTRAASEFPAERDAAVDRLLDYYLHTAASAVAYLTTGSASSTKPPVTHPPRSTPDLATRQAALSWFEAERANLRAVTEYAALHAHQSHAISFPAVIHPFLRAYGPWDQALTLHHTALNAARTIGDRHGEATALNNLGDIQHLTGDYHDAIINLKQALLLYHDLHDRHGQANTLNNLGLVHYLTNYSADATTALEQALLLYRDLHDRHGQANALSTLGLVQRQARQHDLAIVSLDYALALYRDLDDRHGQADALRNLGAVHLATKHYADATTSLEQALTLYGDLNDRHGQANTLLILGVVQQQTQDYGLATTSLKQALALYRDLDDRRGQANAHHYLGAVQLATGQDLADATTNLEQAQALYRDLGAQPNETNAFTNINNAKQATRQPLRTPPTQNKPT